MREHAGAIEMAGTACPTTDPPIPNTTVEAAARGLTFVFGQLLSEAHTELRT
jgi:hypothetical protein